MLSPLKSPTATDWGPTPTPYVTWGANVPPPTFIRTLTEAPRLLAVTRSSKPSPLKSPAATHHGLVPTTYVTWASKPPASPRLRSTLIVSVPSLARARSG